MVDPQRAEEAVTRLSRVGIDNTLGFLEGGMEAWIKKGIKLTAYKSISVNEFEKQLNAVKILLLMLETIANMKKAHLINSHFYLLDEFSKNHKKYDSNKKLFIHCQGGYRSMIACSLIKRKGFDNIIDVQGGFAAISKNTSLENK